MPGAACTGPAREGEPETMEPVCVAIVDDEPLARRRLRRLLEAEGGIEIVGEFGDGREAAKAVPGLAPDVLFLDVRMPHLDGFTALEAMGDAIPWIVFVTAYEEYAVRAFEVRALDYLLKPVDAPRLHDTLERVRRTLAETAPDQRLARIATALDDLRSGQSALRDSLAGGPSRYPEHLLVKDGSEAHFIATDEIDWIAAAGNYVQVHAGRRTHTVRRGMDELERLLDPDRFIRIHRSTIVRVDRIERLRPRSGGAWTVELTGGTELVLSRGYRARLFDRIGGDL